MVNGCSKRGTRPKQDVLQDVKGFILRWVWVFFTKKILLLVLTDFFTVIFFSVMGKEMAHVVFHEFSPRSLSTSLYLALWKKKCWTYLRHVDGGKEDSPKQFSGWFWFWRSSQSFEESNHAIYLSFWRGSAQNHKANVYDLTFTVFESCGFWWTLIVSNV